MQQDGLEGPAANPQGRGRAATVTAGRSGARLAAVQALYQMEQTGIPARTVVEEFLAHRLRGADDLDLGHMDRSLFRALVPGIQSDRQALDALLAKVLPRDWPLVRLDAVLRAVLRAGTYELLHCPEVPFRVVVSEYLDIAHSFFQDKEPGLVNGILGRLATDLRLHEEVASPGASPGASSGRPGTDDETP